MSLGTFLTLLAITLFAFWWFTGGRRANGKSADEGVQSQTQISTYQKRTSELGIQFDEHGNPDMQSCFDVAFSRLSKQLSGIEPDQLIVLSKELKDNDGAFEYQTKLMLSRLGTSDWRWSSYRKKLDTPQKYKEMTQNFIRMLGRTAYALYRHEQRMQMTEFNPYWQFKRPNFEDSSEHCKAYDGVVKHYKDPFWKKVKIPCSPNCSCDIYTRSAQALERAGIAVPANS